MKTLMALLVVVVALMAAARAMPRFLAIPLEDVELVEVPLSNSRSVRQVAVALDHDQEQEAARVERQAGGGGGGDHHDHVDYGAHTGHHGAFGWYADFPVLKHH